MQIFAQFTQFLSLPHFLLLFLYFTLKMLFTFHFEIKFKVRKLDTYVFQIKYYFNVLALRKSLRPYKVCLNSTLMHGLMQVCFTVNFQTMPGRISNF